MQGREFLGHFYEFFVKIRIKIHGFFKIKAKIHSKHEFLRTKCVFWREWIRRSIARRVCGLRSKNRSVAY